MAMDQDISAFQDLREIATLPVAAALTALAITWVVWYFTGNGCTEEISTATGCNASAIAAFITPAMLKDIVTNSAIAATGGGIWSYIMITRERRAREAAERALSEERQRAEEERNRLLAEIERLTRQIDSQQEEPSDQTEC